MTFEVFPFVSKKEMQLWHDATSFRGATFPSCYTVVASNEHYIRKESQKGDKIYYASTLFE